MKKKIFSISLIVILALSSMLLTATPAGAVDLAWSAVGVPNPPLSNQITAAATDVDVANVTVAPNGDLFVIDSVAGDTIYKSTTGGYSWIPTQVAAGITIADIAVSPSYNTDATVFVLAAGAVNAQAYISTNGGTSFSVLGGTAAGVGSSIAIAPNYAAGNGEVMVGTATDVYIWGRGGVLNWTATTLAQATYDVAFSPNYPIDGTRLAISTTGAAIQANTLVGSDAGWDATLTTPAPITADAAITSADLAFPSDFNASLPVARTFFVGINGGAADDVYRAVAGSAAPTATAKLGLGAPSTPIQSIAYSGTTLTGTLFAGQVAAAAVWRCNNPTANVAVVQWTPNFGAPTGATATYVALANDYASSSRVYVGTADAAANGNSAFSVSDDNGAYYYQTGLIDTDIAGINDMAFASASEIFLFTNDGAGTADSLWKTSNGGATWNRVYAFVSTGNAAIIALSPEYATDNTLFLGDTGATGANAMWMSNNGGNSFTGRAVPGVTVNAIAVKDMYTVLVGGANLTPAGAVQMTANGGWTWQPGATVAGGTNVTDIEIDAASGHILVGLNNGGVARSVNNNVSYIPVGVAFAGTNAVVAFDANYGDNNIVYGATTAGAAVVARFQVGTSTAWLAITPPAPAAPATNGFTGPAADMTVAPDGTLYVTDSIAVPGVAPFTGGLARSINPTAGLPTLSLVEWSGAIPAPTVALGAMQVIEGSNVIYAVNTAVATGAILTYTDTLTQATPEVVGPLTGAISDQPDRVTLEWGAVVGATQYQYRYSTRADYNPTTTVSAFRAAPFTSVNTGAASLNPGTNYYWQVRVSSPLLGPWSSSETFETELQVALPNHPNVASPAEGGTGYGGWDASINPTFQWATVGGATNYEFQLSTNNDFTDLIVDATGDNALGNVTAFVLTDQTLSYDDTYFWRVRAISATSTTDWSPTVAFQTMAEPVAPSEGGGGDVTVEVPDIIIPDITVPPVEIPDIIIPETDGGDGVAPGYMWAVIIIGAVLVIALIVLIVRTRRTV